MFVCVYLCNVFAIAINGEDFLITMKHFDILTVLLLSTFLFLACGEENVNIQQEQVKDVAVAEPTVRKKANRIVYFNCRREFNDMNDAHKAAAVRIGIKPLASRKDMETVAHKLHLIGGPNRFAEPFVVDELTHSSPFLVKEAVDLLTDIGRNFQDSLKNKHLPEYSVIVTSVLRTDADVKKLSRRNVNASERSVHCYGTTVDITYKRFQKHDDEAPDAKEVELKGVLAEVLRDLRKAGRCYVKYEVKQACFHVTARK